MLGTLLHIATHDTTPPPVERRYAWTLDAYKRALSALHAAQADPDTDPVDIATLESMAADYAAMLRDLEPQRPDMSVGWITGMATYGTTAFTF